MKLTNVEKKEKNEVVLSFTVDAQVFSKACEQAYRKQVKSIAIPGFRKGKAPRAYIERIYGKEVFYDEALEICFPDEYLAALKEADLVAVDQPHLTSFDVKEDGSAEMVVSVLVKPEVTVENYKGLEAEKEDDTVTDEEVDAEMARLQDRNSRLVSVDREAQLGDTVNLDFEGFVDGVAFEGGKGEKFDLELGSGAFIPGFEDQLVGKKAEESCDVNVTFPEEYQEKSLAGKPAVFKCTVNEVKMREKPVLDDEFAKDVSEFDTLAELKDDTRKTMQERKSETAKNNLENKLLDQIVDAMTVDIPDAMVETRLDDMVQDYSYRLSMQGMDFASYLKYTGIDEKTFRNMFREQALRQVKSRLALESIAKQEGLEPTDEEIEAEYAKLSEQNGMKIEQVKQYLDAELLKGDLACQKATALVVSNAVLKAKEAAKPAKKTAKKPAKKAEEPAEAAEEKTEEKPKRTRKTTKKTEEKPAEKPAE